jgi:hypothetical protein
MTNQPGNKEKNGRGNGNGVKKEKKKRSLSVTVVPAFYVIDMIRGGVSGVRKTCCIGHRSLRRREDID